MAVDGPRHTRSGAGFIDSQTSNVVAASGSWRLQERETSKPSAPADGYIGDIDRLPASGYFFAAGFASSFSDAELMQ
jgi:hypothetical protein